jgi:regulation of enolase protein 1 (concanavalin A-like superfamily)
MWLRQIRRRLQPRRTSSVRSRPRLVLELEILEQRLAPALKGLASYDFEMPAIQPSWAYNWGAGVPANNPPNVEFVPMVWGYNGNPGGSFVNWLNWVRSQPGVREILGFNEPDSPSQANLTVAQALDGWQYMSQLGLPLVSPATTNPTNQWMQDFMAGAAQRGYRVDAVAIHWYGGDNPSSFLSTVDWVHNLYNKPVWITEFGLADWSGHHGYSPEQAYHFMSQVIPQLDQRPYVQRYCWFPTVTTDPYVGMSALFNSDWSLTPVGNLYATYGEIPRDWVSAQIGNPSIAGSAGFLQASGTWTVSGSGADIAGTVDQFHFLAQSFPGDGSVTARVTSVQNTDPWAKAGVMFRDSADPGTVFADVMVTPGNGVIFQWRDTPGGPTDKLQVTGLHAPVWVQVVRAGDAFSGYYSADGVNWSQIGSTHTVVMSAVARAGLAVTSHNVNALTIANFSNVSVLPASSRAGDVGAPGLPGSSLFDPTAGTWTVSGSGADIWNTSDQFHFLYQPFSGNGEIVARVFALGNTGPFAKAGAMIRESLAANSRHALVDLTPSQGVEFIRRTATGANAVSNFDHGVSAPYWVRLMRRGNTFTAFDSPDGVTWNTVGSVNIPIGNTVYAGLAVCAFNNGTVNTATFDNLSIVAQADLSGAFNQMGAVTDGTPFVGGLDDDGNAYSATLLGSTLAANGYTFNLGAAGGANAVQAAGQSISLPAGRFSVLSLLGTGVNGSQPGQTFVVNYTDGSSDTFTQDMSDWFNPQGYGGEAVAAALSYYDFMDGSSLPVMNYLYQYSFVLNNQKTVSSISLPQNGNVMILSTVCATSARVSLLPPGWDDADIGGPGRPGYASFNPDAGTWAVGGSGADIWNVSDQFHFVYQRLSGDGEIVARVIAVGNTGPYAKAGVMIRESVAANSRHALVEVTPSQGVEFIRRTATGGTAVSNFDHGVSAPYWVRLMRRGTTFTAFDSPDGATWHLVGSVDIPMGSSVYAGLAVCAFNNDAVNAATFANMSVLPHVWSLPPGWSDADIGGPGRPGYADFNPDAGTWTIGGSGADIAGTADQFHFVSQGFTGGATLTARVTGITNTDPWAKMGVMFRDSADPNAVFADVMATPGNGVIFQWRDTPGGSTDKFQVTGLHAPVWVQLVRAGDAFSGYYSTDGVNWIQIGSTHTVVMSPTALVGLAVSSHNNGTVNTATFDNASIVAPGDLPGAFNRAGMFTAGTTFDAQICLGTAYFPGDCTITTDGPVGLLPRARPIPGVNREDAKRGKVRARHGGEQVVSLVQLECCDALISRDWFPNSGLGPEWKKA